jgi:hypothetical protein
MNAKPDRPSPDDDLIRSLAALRHAITVRSVPLEEREAMLAALAELHASFAAHAATNEGPGSLLADIERDAPRLHHAVGRASADHTAILTAVDDVRFAATRGAPLCEIRTDAARTADEVDRHLGRVVGMVHDAYTTDTGAGD